MVKHAGAKPLSRVHAFTRNQQLRAYLTVRGINIDVVYKDIKHLHIGVYPPLGRVRVAAPLRLHDDDVRLAVIQRLSWIKRQREQFRTADRQSAREMVSGESHYVWGVRHRLRVVERPGRAHVEVDGERLLLYVPDGMDGAGRLAVLQRWQRAQLRQRIPALIGRWEPAVGNQSGVPLTCGDLEPNAS